MFQHCHCQEQESFWLDRGFGTSACVVALRYVGLQLVPNTGELDKTEVVQFAGLLRFRLLQKVVNLRTFAFELLVTFGNVGSFVILI